MPVSCSLYSMPLSLSASRSPLVVPLTCPEPDPEATHCVDAQPKTFTLVVVAGKGNAPSSLRRRTRPSPSMRRARLRPSSMTADFCSSVISTESAPRYASIVSPKSSMAALAATTAATTTAAPV